MIELPRLVLTIVGSWPGRVIPNLKKASDSQSLVINLKDSTDHLSDGMKNGGHVSIGHEKPPS